jgi:hypothetical protein
MQQRELRSGDGNVDATGARKVLPIRVSFHCGKTRGRLIQWRWFRATAELSALCRIKAEYGTQSAVLQPACRRRKLVRMSKRRWLRRVGCHGRLQPIAMRAPIRLKDRIRCDDPPDRIAAHTLRAALPTPSAELMTGSRRCLYPAYCRLVAVVRAR